MATELIEQLADAEHASWARWMAYLFSKCSHGSQGALIPLGLVERWQRQIDTPYADLSEQEKESDRDEVRLILPFIEAAVDTARAELTGEIERLAAENERLLAVLAELIPFTEEQIDGAYRPADVPIMMDWPIMRRARAVLEGRPSKKPIRRSYRGEHDERREDEASVGHGSPVHQ